MNKEDFLHDYIIICSLRCPINKKCRMLTELFSVYKKFWRVIGITKDALEIFKQNDFKYKSKIGINRSHIKDRNVWLIEMINKNFKNPDELWNFYYENDKTILSTSSENLKKISSEIYYIDDTLELFISSGYSWTHRDKYEVIFLKNLYNEKLLKLNLVCSE